MKYLEAECEVLKQVDEHPNIVKMHEIYDTPKKLHIVMELVTGGQLLQRLATKGLYSEAVTAQCIRSIADALAYCHSKGAPTELSSSAGRIHRYLHEEPPTPNAFRPAPRLLDLAAVRKGMQLPRRLSGLPKALLGWGGASHDFELAEG